MKVLFKFHDEIGVTRCLGIFEQAAAECFGIAAGWLNKQGLFDMFDAGFIQEGDEIFQVACLSCETAYRFILSKIESETSLRDENELALETLRTFGEQAPCQHFDQFMAFRESLNKDVKYSIRLAQEICERANQIKDNG